MVQLQEFILKHLHHHTIFNMFSDGTFKAHRAQILSCSSLGANVWLTPRLIFQPFNYLPQYFPQHFVCNLDYPTPQLQTSFDVCTHIPSTLWVSTFYVVFMATNTLEPMMQFKTPLPPLHEMLASMWDKNNFMRFFQSHSTPLIDVSTLCLPKLAFAPNVIIVNST